jgi:hypothetical protein
LTTSSEVGGTTSALRDGDAIARRSRGEGIFFNKGGSATVSSSQQASHKSKSQNCDRHVKCCVSKVNKVTSII